MRRIRHDIHDLPNGTSRLADGRGCRPSWGPSRHRFFRCIQSVKLTGSCTGGARVDERLNGPPANPPDVNHPKGLRSLLGDWCDPITVTEGWSDRFARLSLYQERGLDPALTHFPPEAFDEAVELVGLRDIPNEAHAEPQEDDAMARSMRAFERLLTLERALRRFIADAMEAEFGAEWMRRQLPSDMFEDWRAKQAKVHTGAVRARSPFHHLHFRSRGGSWPVLASHGSPAAVPGR